VSIPGCEPSGGRTPGRRPRVPPNCDLTLGMVCVDKSEPGVTVWRMAADARFANPVGVIQGGIVGAFADSAMAASTVTWAGAAGLRVHTANVEMKLSFFRPARAEGDITCTARVVSGGWRVVFVEAEVADGGGVIVAKASSTYVLTPREL
jgi:uncharacterized protein (TIGR00369 family)